MAEEAALEFEAADAIHTHQDRPVGDMCTGCVELTERLDRLEHLVAELQAVPSVSRLGTRMCYWICLLVHALFAFGCMSSEMAILVAYPVLLGAAATLTICHVLTNRSFLHKSIRSLFSANVVVFAACCGLVISDNGESLDLLGLGLIVVPAAFFPGWLAAKIYVWSAGWSIIVPSSSDVKHKLQIRDLFALTFVAAIYLGLLRLFVIKSGEPFDSDFLAYILYTGVPVLLVTLATVPIARIMLDQTQMIKVRAVLGIIATAMVVMMIGYWGLLAANQGNIESSEILSIIVACIIPGLFLFASPIFTFIMMRSANYCFVKRPRA